MSPVHVPCPACKGHGRLPPDWNTCRDCDGIGITWEPGAPDYGCKMVLSSRKIGEIVTLGNGERGRIIRHDKRGTPTTAIALIGVFDGIEEKEATHYPSCVGVASVSSPAWFGETPHGSRGREDPLDPLQRKQKP